MERKGGTRLWPLYFAFVVMFSGSVFGLVAPRILGDKSVTEETLWLIFFMSIGLGIMLAIIPRITDWYDEGRLATEVGVLTKEVGPDAKIHAQLARIDQSLAAGGATRAVLKQIQEQLDETAPRWKRTETIEAKVAVLDEMRRTLAEITAQLGTAANLKKLDEIATDAKKALEASSKVADLSKQLEVLTTLQQRLDTIDTTLKEKLK